MPDRPNLRAKCIECDAYISWRNWGTVKESGGAMESEALEEEMAQDDIEGY